MPTIDFRAGLGQQVFETSTSLKPTYVAIDGVQTTQFSFHGGVVTITTPIGQGARVSITFPDAENYNQGDRGPPGPPGQPGKDGSLAGDASAASAAATGSPRLRSFADWFGDEKNAAGYVYPTDTLPSQAINRAIVDAGGQGVVKVPPGIYNNPGDILVRQAGRVSNGSSGGLVLDMRGVIFTGTGRLIIDSSKFVTVIGLDAKGYTLALRGAWRSSFESCNFDVLAFGDGTAGIEYTENYWNEFYGVGYSVVRVQAESNQITLTNCVGRGDAQQGWATPRAFAFEFNGNVNAQAWRVVGGDVSYYSNAIYSVSSLNTGGDVDLIFEGSTYFDTLVPVPWSGRSNVRVVTQGAFLAQPKVMNGCGLPAASRGDHEGWSGSVAMGWRSFANVNHIPNGDLSIGLMSYVGAGRPIINAGGATVTEQPGGFNGRYLNINQPSGDLVYIFSNPLPVTGQYTPILLVRAKPSTSAGTVQFGFGGQYLQRQLKEEWEVVTFSPLTASQAGSQYQITLNNPSGFNIDVMYMGVVLGDRAPLFTPNPVPPMQERSNTITPGTIEPGIYGPVAYIGGFTGLSRGDFVEASYDQTLKGCQLIADIANENQVTVQFFNPSGNIAQALAAGTVRVRVRKAT